MTKDALDSLAGIVPKPIASGGVGRRATDGLPKRADRPLGKRGTDILGRVPLFSGLSRRHLRRLAELSDELSLPRGATIVEAGMLGGTFYVILQGEAKVVQRNRTVARLRPGDFFGEISLLDGGPRTATVIAETPLVVIRIYKRQFVKLISEERSVAVKVLEEVARRLRSIERPLTA